MNVYVIGLGHIGLPMATWFALKGHYVMGIDINKDVVQSIYEGKVAIHEFYEGEHISKVAKELISNQNMEVFCKLKRIDKSPSVFVVTVGIATLDDGSQDVSPIKNALELIVPNLETGDLLLFKTTMIPGTIEELVVPIVRTSGKDIFIAYSPETILETAAFEELEKNYRILAGIDEESFRVAEEFLKTLTTSPIYKASSIKVAEMVKVIQNIDRDVNIALINEISEVARYLGIDVYELKDLVNTHPRVNLLSPGPGVGGYCLPNALKYLEEGLDEDGKKILSLTKTARSLNDERPSKIVQVVTKALTDCNKKIEESTVGVLGLAMKDYCADFRLSPALDVISLLQKKGATVKAYDPLVPEIVAGQVGSYFDALKDADCIVITAIQKEFKFSMDEIIELASDPVIIVDTRNTIHDDQRIRLLRV